MTKTTPVNNKKKVIKSKLINTDTCIIKKEYNSKNERIKKLYFQFLTEADGKASSTINGIRKAILRFEQYTKLKDFACFNKEQAIGFKKYLTNIKTIRTKESLSKSTMLATINPLKDFFKWLAYQPGYKSRIEILDIEYLNLSDKETRAAKTSIYKPFPTLDQILAVIKNLPTTNEIELRDRALIAFTLLTGMRDSAIASLKLKHLKLEQRLVVQDPREVKTKFSKRIDTFFFPVGVDLEQIVVDWVNYLLKKKLYDLSAPVFPRTELIHDENNSFTAGELKPIHWKTTTQIRKIFKKAFESAGLPYYNPHSFRNTLVELGQKICTNPEQFKAWSQNLGHESPLTTFISYGTLSLHRQREVMEGLSFNSYRKM